MTLVLIVGLMILSNLASAPKQSPTSPVQPATNMIFDSARSGNHEVYSSQAGGAPARLTNDAKYDSWWGRISPDKQSILFYRTPAGVHDRDYTKTSLWMMDASGANQRQVLANKSYGWTIQGHAEWSPDGRQLVMVGDAGLYITDTSGRALRQIGVGQDPSWSPDGKQITYNGCADYPKCNAKQYEIYVTPSAGGQPTRLTQDDSRDQDPYFSPDGSSIAWIKQTGPLKWGIYRRDANGAIKAVIDDGKINSKPDWAGDSRTIYFHRLADGAVFDIYSIHTDGSKLRRLNLGKGPNEYPDAY